MIGSGDGLVVPVASEVAQRLGVRWLAGSAREGLHYAPGNDKFSRYGAEQAYVYAYFPLTSTHTTSPTALRQ